MDRFESTKRAGILGIMGNIILLVLKSIVGFASNSQAMIADSLNSASDIFASLMTFIGNKISSLPGDNNHNFGHGKAEYIFSLLISISMIAIALKLLYNSIISLIYKNIITFSWFLVFVCLITIFIKLSLYIYTRRLYKLHNNILLEANYKDHKNDCIVTTFTLISVLLTLNNIYWFDGMVGIGISIWICYTGIKIFIESYNVLMDISIDERTKDLILNIIHNYKQIKRVDNITSTPVGYQYLIMFEIYVDGNMSTFNSHDLANDLEKDIKCLDKVYNVIIHVNPL